MQKSLGNTFILSTNCLRIFCLRDGECRSARRAVWGGTSWSFPLRSFRSTASTVGARKLEPQARDSLIPKNAAPSGRCVLHYLILYPSFSSFCIEPFVQGSPRHGIFLGLLEEFLCDIGEFVFEGGIADFSTEEGFKITSRGLAVKEEGFLPFSFCLCVIKKQ